MKHIAKSPEEPEGFAEWKSSLQVKIDRKMADGASGEILWELLPSSLPQPETEVDEPVLYAKSLLRRTLLEEQGYLCCYCNRALADAHTTIIEHFHPKGLSIYRHQVFDYQNLFACCDGGEREKSKPRETYCTLYKGNNDPLFPVSTISPLEAGCEDLLEYDEQGQIHAINKDARAEHTIAFLNLGAKSLQLQRKAAINTYIFQVWSDEMDTTVELELLKTKINGKFEPFCMAVYSVLRSYP